MQKIDTQTNQNYKYTFFSVADKDINISLITLNTYDSKIWSPDGGGV